MKIRRLEKITDFLNSNKVASVGEISELIDKSESTVRRDLKELVKQGILEETPGGVKLPVKISKDILYGERDVINASEKERIAEYAASLIEPGDSLFIDSGTTTSRMLKYINKFLIGVRIFTNSTNVAYECSSLGLDCIMLPGKLKHETGGVVGDLTISFLNEFSFDKAFIGTNSITINKGYSTLDYKEALVKKTVTQNSVKNYVVSDYSKINASPGVSFLGVNDATLITDKGVEFVENVEVVL